MTQSYRAYKMAASCTLFIANVELAIFFYAITPLLRAIAKQEWMVGQTQRAPTHATERSK